MICVDLSLLVKSDNVTVVLHLTVLSALFFLWSKWFAVLHIRISNAFTVTFNKNSRGPRTDPCGKDSSHSILYYL